METDIVRILWERIFWQLGILGIKKYRKICSKKTKSKVHVVHSV